MRVLVDTSVWIDYFRGGERSDRLNDLIDENVLVINELILAELFPFMMLKKQSELMALLSAVAQLEMRIDWQQIIDYKYTCIKNGVNGVGIPDLIIAQNAVQNECEIYSLDAHFENVADLIDLKIL